MEFATQPKVFTLLGMTIIIWTKVPPARQPFTVTGYIEATFGGKAHLTKETSLNQSSVSRSFCVITFLVILY
jgi:hypothetical protein